MPKPSPKKKPNTALASTIKETLARPVALNLKKIEPLTESQQKFFEAFDKDYNVILSGSAGAGKTFIALAKALELVIKSKFKKRLVIVRSVVPTRDMGFLPGTQGEKEAAYTVPYISIVNDLFGDGKAWEALIKRGAIRFITTSYIRGITLNNSVIVVDECQNCNFHELDSIMTRIGDSSRIIFAGDYYQSDFSKSNDRKGILRFFRIIDKLNYFKHVEFTWEDIVRSQIVRDYIMTREIQEREENGQEPEKPQLIV
jgi:phosphate starvation-inducible protein PhoH and related proteins